MRIATRGGSGLGDSLYLQSVVRHFVENGELVEVCSDWPDVFRPLAGKVTVSPFRRDRITRLAHYTRGKSRSDTTQFQDCCFSAGIKGPVDLRLDWQIAENDLVATLRRQSLPIVVVQLPRSPMARADGFAADLLPDCRRIEHALDRIREHAFVVQIGCGEPLYRFSEIDLDLSNKTTVAEMIDVAALASGFVGYCSFLVPLAESLKKPALFVWSRRGLNAPRQFISSITPRKIIERPDTSRVVIDDCRETDLHEAVDAFLDQARSGVAFLRQVGGDRRERVRLAG